MSQCDAAESSSQVEPQVIDGKERSPLDDVLCHAREDPTAMPPGTDGVFMQPAPDRASAEGGDQASLADVPGQISGTPTGERQVVEGGQFTGQRLYPHDQIWGKKSGADRTGALFQAGEAVFKEPFAPLLTTSRREPRRTAISSLLRAWAASKIILARST